MIKEEQSKAEPPKDEPLLGTGIKGDGPDSFSLSGKPGNGQMGSAVGNGSRWGSYAFQVQGWVIAAMQRNRKTRGEAERDRQSLTQRRRTCLARTTRGYYRRPFAGQRDPRRSSERPATPNSSTAMLIPIALRLAARHP